MVARGLSCGTDSSIETYPEGVGLIPQGKVARDVYWVDSGGVKLVHTYPEGREIILDLKLPGELVGASSVMLSEPCAETAITTVRSELVRWPAADFLAELRENLASSAWVGAILSREAQHLRARLMILGHGCLRSKLIHFLGSLDSIGGVGGTEPRPMVHLPLKQRDLARLLAVSPRHLV